MRTVDTVREAVGIAAFAILFSLPAVAADLNGVWASDARVCEKIFVKNAGGVVFRDDSDMYGSGFIIDANKIRGRTATCNITSRKEDAGVVHILASCATDIMLSSVQFSVKQVDQDKLTRFFPGIPEMEMFYERCRI
jgi:hypothetical protein